MPSGIYKRTEKTIENISIGLKKYHKNNPGINKGINAPGYKDGRTLKKYYCINCGKELKNYISKKCKFCYINNIKGKNHPNYKNGKTLRKNYCIDCGKEIACTSKRCWSCSSKKQWQNFEYREKNSINTKEQWQNGCFDNRKIHIESPSQPEKEIMKMLEELGIDYIFQYRPKNYSKIYDFYISKLNLLIEYDSEFWHRNTQERDAEKTRYAKNNGYKLLRINEKNLNELLRRFYDKFG